MHRNRHTKIVATLGPASSSAEMIQWLFDRGVDVFRLNFSHGRHDTHAQNIRWIRDLEYSTNRPIGILADLQGPKLRVGRFELGSVNIAVGQRFIFDMDETPGNEERVQLPHPEIFKAAQKGDELLVDDGKLAFRVDYVDPLCIQTTALVGGLISNNKGLNLPSTHLPIEILTEKDKLDLAFALDQHVDFVALSFVQTADDIIKARMHMNKAVKIIAKLEKPQAIHNLKAILEEADAVMIARGDLGVELPAEQLPPLQRRILKEAQSYNCPVIVATQMLESMINSPKPTRAEVSDVATAVYLGTDAVMLSAESASGQYPKEAVAVMDRIIYHAEQDIKETKLLDGCKSPRLPEAALSLTNQNQARAIVLISNSLTAITSITSLKPTIPILVVTSDQAIYHQLTLLYGVYPIYKKDLPNVNNPQAYKNLVEKLAKQAGVLTQDQQVLTILVPDTFDANQFSSISVLNTATGD